MYIFVTYGNFVITILLLTLLTLDIPDAILKLIAKVNLLKFLIKARKIGCKHSAITYIVNSFKECKPYHWIMSIIIDVLVMTAQLIAIVDPVGALPIMVSMPGIDKPEVFRRALRIIAIAVPSLLIIFAVVGPYILSAFNISIADFRIAGGIVLLVIGIDTLREGAPRTMA